MTDRELLELAAKAAGIEVDFESEQWGKFWAKALGFWNPLTDDGDALRLAVATGLNIEVHRQGILLKTPFVEVRGYQYRRLLSAVQAKDNEDSLASATRRAITMAAAEMGRITGRLS